MESKVNILCYFSLGNKQSAPCINLNGNVVAFLLPAILFIVDFIFLEVSQIFFPR